MRNKVINLGNIYCYSEYIVLNSIQLLGACLLSSFFDQMQYFMLSPMSKLSSVFCVSMLVGLLNWNIP